jgi:hypothetical protein
LFVKETTCPSTNVLSCYIIRHFHLAHAAYGHCAGKAGLRDKMKYLYLTTFPYFFLSLFICILFLPVYHSSSVFHFILPFTNRSYWPRSHFYTRKLEKSQSLCLSACLSCGRSTDDFMGRPVLPIKQLYYENTQIDFPRKLVQGPNAQCTKNSNNKGLQRQLGL